MQETKRKSRISAPKALLGILLAIVILATAQSLAFSISEIFLNAGLPGAICNILAGILYVVLAFLGVDLFCKKYLKISREKMRIPGFRLKTGLGIIGCPDACSGAAVIPGFWRSLGNQPI